MRVAIMSILIAILAAAASVGLFVAASASHQAVTAGATVPTRAIIGSDSAALSAVGSYSSVASAAIGNGNAAKGVSATEQPQSGGAIAVSGGGASVATQVVPYSAADVTGTSTVGQSL